MIILLVGLVVAFLAFRYISRDNKVMGLILSLLIIVIALLGSQILNTILTEPTITKRKFVKEDKLQSFENDSTVYAYSYKDPQRPLAHIVKVVGDDQPKLVYEAEVKEGEAKLVTEKVTKHYKFTLWFLPSTEKEIISTIYKPANSKIVEIE